ncbi:uncharacterized protein MYCFIDRAFT_212767 [Pseudocercospora fijiensis CIRAD86]|uniref:Uncharacterized protein n=1 Tax=Pseudocercospora fijiensis (strain CIRAD86) TaxID=383855 RepID=M2ZCG0_PSEFD|nr:uncharacterized protein MYCFIDRAFT_212767 [Pseudocercospora fijiensis CIRAD86]EME76774.1 hypothetical protein MYCFIDRAFT_212767 [Pseudocercospora fijiensis CIRAD86]
MGNSSFAEALDRIDAPSHNLRHPKVRVNTFRSSSDKALRLQRKWFHWSDGKLKEQRDTMRKPKLDVWFPERAWWR